MSKPQEFTIKVQSEDAEKKEKPESDKPNFEGSSKLLKDSKEGEGGSEEDQQLKDQLEMLVERLKELNTELYRSALETLRTLIRTSTSSMTSVPKPLKFLRPHYPDLQALYETWAPSEDKVSPLFHRHTPFNTSSESLRRYPLRSGHDLLRHTAKRNAAIRTISGFQTHQSPVRLGTTERAELATEEFIPFSHVLEGFVILQKNAGWETEDKMEL
ncbi:unnamed protein product [Cyclocybe aegerita]|uniref:Uncharacterized protein n=1 Tax=Cyclocybe aegerita TaxID=1973307 RepID=A0A8S0WJJ8_CYCAE|nr:unnamed protein product [Cyclocybe aegerita]